MLSQVAPDRRPAIWPWLVMPLITLVLYYSLDRLNREQEKGSYRPAPQATATADNSTPEDDSGPR
jgi:hypothetical protein